MYHDFIEIELLAKEDVPEALSGLNKSILRLTCRETNNVLLAAIRSNSKKLTDDIRQRLMNEQAVEFDLDFVGFTFHQRSGGTHSREMQPGLVTAKCFCKSNNDKFSIFVSLDRHHLALLVVSTMWFANYHDFRLIELLCNLDPWGFHYAGKRFGSEWGDGIQVADMRRNSSPRYSDTPMTANNFDLHLLLQRMKNPQAPVYFSELLQWAICSDDTLKKYLKRSGIARANTNFKGWSCGAADIVDRFIPYLKTLSACHPTFFKIEEDLTKVGIIS